MISIKSRKKDISENSKDKDQSAVNNIGFNEKTICEALLKALYSEHYLTEAESILVTNKLHEENSHELI